MNKIKNVTFEALDNLANQITLKNKSLNYEKVRLKISDYLITDGNKKFVETYNELAKTKNFEKAIKTLKL
jgi:hypothetical protein